MKKKILGLLMSLTLIFGTAIPAMAGEGIKNVMIMLRETPQLHLVYTYQLREVMEKSGYQVEWNGKQAVVSGINKEGHKVSWVIEQNEEVVKIQKNIGEETLNFVYRGEDFILQNGRYFATQEVLEQVFDVKLVDTKQE